MGIVQTCATFAVLATVGLQSTLATSAGPDPSTWIAECGGAYNLCGFVERGTKKQRIKMEFERVLAFSEGLAGVRVEGKYGYIDSLGRIVIAPKFDLVGEFRNGHAETLVGDQVGIIDRDGSFLLKPAYARAIPFGKTAALVLSGKWRSPYAPDFERLSTDASQFRGNDLFDLIDLRSGKPLQSGLQIAPFDFDTFVWAKRQDGSFYGLLAPDGQWKTEPRYTTVRQLLNGRAIGCTLEGLQTGASPLCGSLDGNGDTALPMVPYKILAYRSGAYRFFSDANKVGLLSEAGEVIGGRLFEDVEFTDPGSVLRVREHGKWIGLTREGKTVADPENDRVLLTCPSGVNFVARNGGFEIVKDGKTASPYIFEGRYVDTDCHFPKPVKFKGKWGFVDADGKLLFDPPFFDNTYYFDQGHAGVSVNGKWGVVDATGNFTVTPQYEDLRPDDDGLFHVTLGKDKFWINSRNEIRPEPRRTEERRATLTCKANGGSLISKNVNGQALWGLADVEGRTLVQPNYRAISCFKGGLAWVPFDDRKKWCPIDKNENIREGLPCVTSWMDERMADAATEKMSDDPYESGVLWMRANLDYGLGVRDQPPRTVGDFRRRF